MNFAIPADHGVKTKENEKRDRYLDLAREIKTLLNLKVMLIPIVVGALGLLRKGLESRLEELEIGELIEIIQTISLLRSTTIFETSGELLPFKLQGKAISTRWSEGMKTIKKAETTEMMGIPEETFQQGIKSC